MTSASGSSSLHAGVAVHAPRAPWLASSVPTGPLRGPAHPLRAAAQQTGPGGRRSAPGPRRAKGPALRAWAGAGRGSRVAGSAPRCLRAAVGLWPKAGNWPGCRPLPNYSPTHPNPRHPATASDPKQTVHPQTHPQSPTYSSPYKGDVGSLHEAVDQVFEQVSEGCSWRRG